MHHRLCKATLTEYCILFCIVWFVVNVNCETKDTNVVNRSCTLLQANGNEFNNVVLGSALLSSLSSDILADETDNSSMSLNGEADITQSINGTVLITSNLNISIAIDTDCPSLSDATSLTQIQLINKLTAPCRYDRSERPIPIKNGTLTKDPVVVYVRSYIYVMQVLDSNNLQFKMQGLLQLRYADARLAFKEYVPNRKEPIIGESQVRNLIWVPHLFLVNEHDSRVLGTNEEDILTSISPDGTVIVSSRIQATLYCWMDLEKFPFDEQQCSTILESWMYNASDLMLRWENNTPIAYDPTMHLTEYSLQYAWGNETLVSADLDDMGHGIFSGNYSSVTFTVHLTREVGYYVMDYFLPSMMIVAISWVSFWLQADQTPARTTLGTSTMLSFITLSSSQDKNLPKVSYIKVSEIWFFGCTLFIFGSLVEFAFVNTIWRRNRNIELKKVNSKYILKSTLTPNMKRRRDELNTTCTKFGHGNYLTVDTPIIITSVDSQPNNFNTNTLSTCSLSIEDNSENNAATEDKIENKTSWSTMTPHEVSLWIDRKARFVFPLAFIVFNAFFWTFVYCL